MFGICLQYGQAFLRTTDNGRLPILVADYFFAYKEIITIMIWLEIFGYVGTALVLFSMTMTNITLLRIINICGSVISATYAYLSDTMPVVLLNLGLIGINIVQLIIEEKRRRQFSITHIKEDDPILTDFLDNHVKDAEKYFPDFTMNVGDGFEIYMIYSVKTPVGLFVGREKDGYLQITFGYVLPEYKYSHVVLRFMAELKESGYKSRGNKIIMPQSENN